ncbi:MAG: hypothetical protein PHT33_02100 [bacterium]|nr:hypothetical protein [bacterium]
MSTFMERLLLMGMGGVAVAQDTARDLMDDLVRRGEMSREEAQGLTRDLEERGRREREEISDMIRTQIARTMDQANIAAKSDIRRLEQRLDELESRLSV